MSLIHDGDRILFQGDSITNCFRMPDEINNAYQLGSGYPLLIGSRLMADRPTASLSFFNRGISGNSVHSLAARWEEDAIALNPNVISILIGVNGYEDIGSYTEAYRQLLERTWKALPDVRFVLCEPFTLSAGDVTPERRSEVVQRAAFVRALASEVNARFVPLQDRFDDGAAITGPEYWIYDGIHPAAPGQWLIAEAWREAVETAG